MSNKEFLSLKKGDKLRHEEGRFVSFGTGDYVFQRFAGQVLDKRPLMANVVTLRKGKIDVFCSCFVKEYLIKVN